ncbi:MAG: hypothetical protein ACRDTZ_15100 [Pseudonocardiaceae bacterium]
MSRTTLSWWWWFYRLRARLGTLWAVLITVALTILLLGLGIEFVVRDMGGLL